MNYKEKENSTLKGAMNMFVAINKLCSLYTFEQAVDIMDIYFKTDDSKYIPSELGIRDYVVNNGIRDAINPLTEGKDHLMDYLEEIFPPKENGKQM